MTAVIGFVDQELSRKLRSDLVLPIGFQESGDIARNDSEPCLLILIDDEHYEATESSIVRAPDPRPALLVQHLGSHKRWEHQNDWLVKLGWRPLLIDRFSHGPGYPFWNDIEVLLKQEGRAARADVLKEMVKRYGAAHHFRLLDVWAAYAILAQVGGESSASDRRKELFIDLPAEWRKRIHNKPLSWQLAEADEILSEFFPG